ncbi:hypothetical protein [Oleiphilus messinensis]|uniref:hypothetical protein n=1 Tax=Oleiphilus messinensis TaxID=141451 RepID=UPI0012F8BD4D|nr:hypothetical protein [Oleiphilus messinensis]
MQARDVRSAPEVFTVFPNNVDRTFSRRIELSPEDNSFGIYGSYEAGRHPDFPPREIRLRVLKENDVVISKKLSMSRVYGGDITPYGYYTEVTYGEFDISESGIYTVEIELLSPIENIRSYQLTVRSNIHSWYQIISFILGVILMFTGGIIGGWRKVKDVLSKYFKI